MMARQPLRSLRVPDRIWGAAMSTANNRGESLNAAINRLLAVYAGVDVPTQPWTTQPDQVLAFGRVLAAADVIDAAGDAFYYVEKPYKWDDLYDKLERLGRPWPPDLGVKPGASWVAFIEHVDAENA
jgi:hypothetical protein